MTARPEFCGIRETTWILLAYNVMAVQIESRKSRTDRKSRRTEEKRMKIGERER
jgi:hypothetical protein